MLLSLLAASAKSGCWFLGQWVKHEQAHSKLELFSLGAAQSEWWGSGFCAFDGGTAGMEPLSAPSGGFTLPQGFIFSRCFT